MAKTKPKGKEEEVVTTDPGTEDPVDDEKSKCFEEGLYLADSPECKRCEDMKECKARSEGLAEKTEEEEAAETKPKKKRASGIKDRALKLLQDESLADKTFGELAEMIRDDVEGAKTSAACLAWYRNRYKDDPEIKIVPRARGRKKKEKEEEKSEPKPKTKTKAKTPTTIPGSKKKRTTTKK